MKIDRPYKESGDDEFRKKAKILAEKAHKEGLDKVDFGTLFDQEFIEQDYTEYEAGDLITVKGKEAIVILNEPSKKSITVEMIDTEDMVQYDYDKLNNYNKSKDLGDYTPMGSSSSIERLMVTKKGDEHEGKIGVNVAEGRFHGTFPYVILDFGSYGRKRYDKTEVTDEVLLEDGGEVEESLPYTATFNDGGKMFSAKQYARLIDAERSLDGIDKTADVKTKIGEITGVNGSPTGYGKLIEVNDTFSTFISTPSPYYEEYWKKGEWNDGRKISQSMLDNWEKANKRVGEKHTLPTYIAWNAFFFEQGGSTHAEGGEIEDLPSYKYEEVYKPSKAFVVYFDYYEFIEPDYDDEEPEDTRLKSGKVVIFANTKEEAERAIYDYADDYLSDNELFDKIEGAVVEADMPIEDYEDLESTYAEGGELPTVSPSRLKEYGEDFITSGKVVDRGWAKFKVEDGIFMMKVGDNDWEKLRRVNYAEGGEINDYNFGYVIKDEDGDVISESVFLMVGKNKEDAKKKAEKYIKDNKVDIIDSLESGLEEDEVSIEIVDTYAEGGNISEFSNLPTLTRIEYKSDWSDKTYKGFILKKESRKDVFGNELYKVLQGANLSTSYGKNPKVVAVNKIVRVIEEATPNTPLYDLAQQYKKLNPSIFRNTYEEGGKVGAYKIDEVLRHFVNAALWSSTNDEDEPLEDEYDFDDIPKEELEKLRGGIKKFIEDNEELLQKYNITDQAVGHDLFLDSQGHGVGFWDRGYDKADGDELSESASKIFASDSPYAQDGKVYFSNVKYAEGGEMTVYRVGYWASEEDEKNNVVKEIEISAPNREEAESMAESYLQENLDIDLEDDTQFWGIASVSTYAEGGEVEMIEIAEDGSNVPQELMEIFSEFNEDEDPYKEMEKLRAKANEIGYDFSYGLDGTPTEFCEIPKKSWGGGIAIGTAVGGYVGYKIGRARTQKKGFETEKKIGKKINKALSKGKEKSGEAAENTKQWLQS